MRLDDLKKLATGSVLFSLDRIIAPRLVGVLYLLGLGAILVWAVRHFFAAFFWGFGNGLWGILEILVFGLLAFVVLRIVCEAVLVYFRAHAQDAETAVQPRSGSLLDDVRDAIEELAGEELDAEAPEEEPSRPRWTAPRTWGPAPGTPATPGTVDPATPPSPATQTDAAVGETPQGEDGPVDDTPRQPSTAPGQPYS